MEDLLRCYPKKYRDYRVPVSVRTQKDRQTNRQRFWESSQAAGFLEQTRDGAAESKDGGNISAVWFNQAFRVRQVVLGGNISSTAWPGGQGTINHLI
ncbi:MAG: hypothetical protein ACLR7U_09335 [Ruthenibacterium lactatiformans]